MSPELLYFVATGATTVGWILVGLAVYRFIRLLMGAVTYAVPAFQRRTYIYAGVGAALVMVGFGIPTDLGRESLEGPTFPIIWPYTPLSGWMVIIGVGMVVAKLIQAKSAIRPEIARKELQVAGLYAVVAGLGWWWLHSQGEKIWILRGQLPLHLPTVAAVVVLAVVAMAVMVAIERRNRAKGIVKAVGIHLTLLAGCFVFGVPFAWLLVTSFKEERDFSSEQGLVWTPKVQLTHAYLDPDNPLFEFVYEGRWVKAEMDSDLGDGKMLVEIDRPYNLRGRRVEISRDEATVVPSQEFVWTTEYQGQTVEAFTVEDLPNGDRELEVLRPESLKGAQFLAVSADMEPVRVAGLRWENYTEALEWMPFETWYGLRYLTNTIWLVVMSVVGTVLSCSLVAYGFSRLRFPGRDIMFTLMLATMMLPPAVTMMPQFLIFRQLGWIDTLMPLWVPTFFGAAFNVFLLKQFFSTIPMELEEAARIDGANYFKTYWSVMMPLVKPALAAISIWTFMGAWNNFMGPLIYISSPENMPLSYALQLFSGDRGTEPGLMMAFATMTVLPVVLLFFFAQRYFIEGVQLSGLGGR